MIVGVVIDSIARVEAATRYGYSQQIRPADPNVVGRTGARGGR
jgi:hypothetical protein